MLWTYTISNNTLSTSAKVLVIPFPLTCHISCRFGCFSIWPTPHGGGDGDGDRGPFPTRAGQAVPGSADGKGGASPAPVGQSRLLSKVKPPALPGRPCPAVQCPCPAAPLTPARDCPCRPSPRRAGSLRSARLVRLTGPTQPGATPLHTSG